MTLRDEIDRNTGTMEATRGVASASAFFMRMLLLVACAVLTTLALGGPPLARTPDAIIGSFVVNLLLITMMVLSLRMFRPNIHDSGRALALLGGLVAVQVVLAFAAVQVRAGSPELVPIAFAGVVISTLFDRRVSLLTVVLLAVLIAAQPDYRTPSALPVMIASGASAALAVRSSLRRDQSYLWILIIAAVSSVAVTAASVAAGAPRPEVLGGVIRAAATSVVSVIAAMLFVPFAERLTGRETHLTLLEWGDLHHPLLQRLSLEAPGTYNHTIALANLADAACRAIGANALLARVGAYYHDIGKLAKPQYFVENQPRGRNPHDKLKPGTSASIIRSHVHEGLDLANEVRLPAAIRAFINEHHGTNTISYFLERAREPDGTVPNASEFIYPGPIPQSAETAVVMLADGVEAIARTLSDPTPERLREVIERVVQQRLDEGQLREAPITLRQLSIVKREFARVLGGMYHARVEYPKTPVPSEPATV
ncbi:MAG TPA: HDIG domain-containing protein [Gemmatimonadaceae bacterium]|nr:HDIG domain-containing protein [Gemmatimonadaceae bacterium]